MFKLLKKPHPFIFNHYSIIIPSAVSFLIIVLLAPYDFQKIGLKYRIIFAAIISMLVALGVWATVKILKKLMPKTMAEDQWTVGKEFLQILFILCIIILLISVTFILFQKSEMPLVALFYKIAFTTIAISILPILVLVLFEQYRHQKLQLKKAATLTVLLKNQNEQLLRNKQENSSTNELLLIKGDNDAIEIQLKPQDLIYFKSDGNYLEIYFNNVNKIQKKVIRNRLKTIENSLPHKLFFRCHNSFIINGNHIVKIEGNARNLTLHLKGISTPIPVSRTKAKAISLFLEKLQKH